jgi:hypothetical protein
MLAIRFTAYRLVMSVTSASTGYCYWPLEVIAYSLHIFQQLSINNIKAAPAFASELGAIKIFTKIAH